jgi:hypothetical protein
VVGGVAGAVIGHESADGRNLKNVKFATQPAWKSGDTVRLQDGKLVVRIARRRVLCYS